jgi:stage V sporulation protein S
MKVPQAEPAHSEVGMDTMTLKVAATSNPATVAGAIANNIRENKAVDIVAMGPKSVNQAVKAVAIARDYLREEKTELTCRPEFIHLQLDGEEKSAIKLVVIVHRS